MMQILLLFLSVFSVIYFVLKKASKSLSNSKRWIKMVKILFACGMCLQLSIIIDIQSKLILISHHREDES
jgi:hypothetical protein